ncbi:hypothetical protein VR44_06570 [Streptomyces katrae]|uniref:Uncharacterized protein n=1 Tax=Streptomyces katrae TaxID=68223 RepID=A0A0F4JTE7_9ACTN|nr:hypothetical protein VR44_06570 [Streptomyces katrae]
MDVNNGLLPADVISDYDVTRYVGKSGGTLSFDLVFDRTYEVADPSVVGEQSRKGVWADVHALYDLVGINEDRVEVSTSGSGGSDSGGLFGDIFDPLKDILNPGGGTSGPPDANSRYRGVMTIRPVYVVFTTDWYAQVGNTTGTARWYGYLNHLDVDFTHWSENMIPLRCTVGTTLQLLVEYGGGS